MGGGVVLGVDPSTRKLAYVVMGPRGQMVSRGSVIVKGKLAADRFEELMAEMRQLICTPPLARLVVIEGVPFVKNRKGAMALATAVGGLQAVCVSFRVPYRIAPGHAWKTALGLSGNANKDAIRAYAETEGPVDDTWGQDEVDAWCLAEYGRRVT